MNSNIDKKTLELKVEEIETACPYQKLIKMGALIPGTKKTENNNPRKGRCLLNKTILCSFYKGEWKNCSVYLERLDKPQLELFEEYI